MDSIDKTISKHMLEKFGWALENFNHATPVTSHFVYFKDWRENKIWLMSLSQEHFNHTKITTGICFDDVVSAIAYYVNKTVRDQVLTEKEQSMLAPLLINYIKQTQNYAAWRRQISRDQRLHFLINVYSEPKSDKDAITLRPFIANADEVMLSLDEVIDLTGQVQRVDKKNHPEWVC
ncbi:hypothetical protein I7V28_18900 [Lelliottia amnigena]|uniref:hypothetical protein n=1 Tax=Lelliottia TaxID=1330545 RepID=UPI00192AEEAF|nr:MULTISPECIES: hypothetical protein [Lelliottia]MBL5885578.1 hypothetical protein [Lelliottia aquatilis]MBL5923150.1 hypothetical protein [Lelliottia amnigena]MBL5932066.1 hypothetical protein [Lelliottia amnigena]